jgi:hypothetical protein
VVLVLLGSCCSVCIGVGPLTSKLAVEGSRYALAAQGKCGSAQQGAEAGWRQRQCPGIGGGASVKVRGGAAPVELRSRWCWAADT